MREPSICKKPLKLAEKEMLAKRIIPCLDVQDGRVVKGVNFVNLRDAGDPVENARFYDEEGADELVFLDITASHEKRKIILDVVARTAEEVFMPLTVGGGIRSTADIRELTQCRRRQGFLEHGRGAESGDYPGVFSDVRQSMHCGRHRRQEDRQEHRRVTRFPYTAAEP